VNFLNYADSAVYHACVRLFRFPPGNTTFQLDECLDSDPINIRALEGAFTYSFECQNQNIFSACT